MQQGLVTILISTYNGDRFLREQLDSLYLQSYPHIKILARDDGSSDATLEILRQQSDGKLEVMEGGANLGPAKSFLALLRQAAATETDYVAFCDQDDVWYPEKVARAVHALANKRDRPALYSSRVELVNETLDTIGLSYRPDKVGFGNALVENIAVGCTMVLNRKAIDLINNNLPNKLYIHDWWCYLVVSCFGEIVFDMEPSIKYRQHFGNTIGAPTGLISALKRKVKRFTNGPLLISEQINEFLNIFKTEVPEKNLAVLNEFVEAQTCFFKRLCLALSGKLWRQHSVDNCILKLLIVIKRL